MWTMNDRIKLAEAMGWVREDDYDNSPFWVNGHRMGYAPDSQWTKDLEIPDPFTDANDDYAVLEWMRNAPNSGPYFDALIPYGSAWQYQIGDYARAALKVLNND